MEGSHIVELHGARGALRERPTWPEERPRLLHLRPRHRASTPDPEVEQLIKDFAIGKGIAQREVSDQEVLERCLYPMINEGAKILDEGIAIRGSDIDVIWVNGYGWPLYRGGPMYWADQVGLAEIVDKINGYDESLGGRHWQLSPLLPARPPRAASCTPSATDVRVRVLVHHLGDHVVERDEAERRPGVIDRRGCRGFDRA